MEEGSEGHGSLGGGIGRQGKGKRLLRPADAGLAMTGLLRPADAGLAMTVV